MNISRSLKLQLSFYNHFTKARGTRGPTVHDFFLRSAAYLLTTDPRSYRRGSASVRIWRDSQRVFPRAVS
jgi:hypothetical protein